ncbi:DICT sensory domain-containing protein [Gloeocapsa sp. PCC 73106]|uniref:DICT sensory domain-containing protein n=1 Tax=Gloeocapsa sp. PCC 73106 TaxID=102232 RepID=UPI0002AC9292|nr:DICT sensory domain-containing protein [Gloeocapsa sp. PCC 73106]ELR99620.1 putative sensor protein [Gloeocapsa sp. PCC 73106]
MLKGSILEKLTNRHLHQKKPLNLGVYYKNTLVALCHALEDFILEHPDSPLIVSAFQRGKWYLEEADRYGKLAAKSQAIVILAAPDAGFGDHPTSNRANVSLVSLPETDPVAQEWHLMIFSPSYSAMVLCQELSEADYGNTGRPNHDLERKFYGFWTFEPELVQETLELTLEHLASQDPGLAEAIAKRIQIISQGVAANSGYDLEAVVTKVVNYLEVRHKNPSLPTPALEDNLSANKIQAFLRMAQIIDQADAANPHSAAEVACLAEAMGQILDLPAWQVRRLKLAGLLHRLPPLQGTSPEKIPNPVQQAVIEQQDSLPQKTVVRVLPQLQAIAKIITHQSEHWDGSGGPEGLAYDNIPLESRILALIANFQVRSSYWKRSDPDYLNQALQNCQDQASTVYDPKLVQTLELLVLALQQGMNIQANQPKIASSIWLLEDNIT